MIRVVGANPALDRISTWSYIRLGEVNRALTVVVRSGGKGLNVTRAAVQLGSQAAIYGFLGGGVGDAIRELVRADGVVDRHTPIAAATRVCFIVVEPGGARVTVLNEPGPDVSPDEEPRLVDDLRADCGPDDIVVLSGSLPDSVDASLAASVIEVGQRAGARTVVDSHGSALRAALTRRPWMLKCNRDELHGLFTDGSGLAALDEHRGRTRAEVAHEMVELHERGIEVVVVTLGADGVLLADDGGVVHAAVPAVEVVNPVGCGDLLLAGLLVGIERARTPRDALAFAAACGTVAATHLAPELPSDFDPDAWTARVTLRAIEPAP